MSRLGRLTASASAAWPLALCAAIGLSGCYHLTGRAQESATEVKTPKETRPARVPMPESDTVEVKVTFEGDDTLILTAERLKTCRDDSIQVSSVDKVTRTELPYHWGLFGVGVAAMAGGAASWGIGRSLVEDNAVSEKGEIPDPDREEKADRGRLFMPVGIGVAVAGLVLLGSETVDLVMARERVEILPPVEVTTPGPARTCRREPAASLGLRVSQGDLAASFVTDAQGKVRVSVLESELETLRFQRPIGVVSCDQCKPLEFDLPPSISGRLTISRRVTEELAAWLGAYPNEKLAPEVQRAYAQRLAEELAERNAGANALLLKGQLALKERRFDDSRAATTECLRLVPGHPDCAALRDRTDHVEAEAALASIKGLVRVADWYGVADAADRCARLEPSNMPCVVFADAARAQIRAIEPDHIEKAVAYSEGDGQVVYFSLVNSEGAQVAAPGRLALGLSFENNGFSFQRVPLVELEVRTSDFRASEVGRGFFARRALIARTYLTNRQIYGSVLNGRYMMKSWTKYPNEGFLEFIFTDHRGRTLGARADFNP